MEEIDNKNYKLLIENLISETKKYFDKHILSAKESFNYIEEKHRASASEKIYSIEQIANGFDEACRKILSTYKTNSKFVFSEIESTKYEYYCSFMKLFNGFEEFYKNVYSNKLCLGNIKEKIDALIKTANELFRSKYEYKNMKDKNSTSFLKIEIYSEKIMELINNIELIKIELRNAIYFLDKSPNKSNEEEQRELLEVIMYYNMIILCRDIIVSLYNSNSGLFDKKISIIKPFDSNNYTVAPEVIDVIKNGILITKQRKILYELYDSYVLYEEGDIRDINKDDVNNIKYLPSKLAEHMKSLIISKLNDKLSMFDLAVAGKNKSIAESYFNDTCNNSNSISELLNYYINIDEVCNNAVETYNNIALNDIHNCSHRYYTSFKNIDFSKKIFNDKEKKDRIEMLETLIKLSSTISVNEDEKDQNATMNSDLIRSGIYLLIQFSKYSDQDGKLAIVKNYLSKYPAETISVFSSVLYSINIININTLSEKTEWASILDRFNALKELYNKINNTDIDEASSIEDKDSVLLGVIISFINLNIKNISRIANRLLVASDNIYYNSSKRSNEPYLNIKLR